MTSDKRATFSRYLLILLFISLIGFLWETIYMSIKFEGFLDRGFLTLPFCPIYGISIMVVYFLIGTPLEGRGILKNVHRKWLRYTLYFILAMAIPTLMELATGWFFDEIVGRRLWTYEGNWMNFRGYICPSVTLFWGVSLTLAMRFIFPHIKNLFFKMPDRYAKAIALSLGIMVSLDFIINLGVSFKNLKSLKI